MNKKIPRFKPALTIGEILNVLLTQNTTVDDKNGIELFTQKFAEYIGIKHAVFVPSARTGLAALLSAMDLPQDGEVILPGLTHHRIASLLKDFGLKPRYVDIDPTTYCIDLQQLKDTINTKTVAILPVHIYGRACNMKMICQIAQENNLFIIEDCAQACGSSFDGKKLGAFGVGAIYSLGAFKNVCALGSGMVVTNSDEIAEKITSYVQQLPQISNLTLIKRILFSIGLRVATNPVFWFLIFNPILWIYSRKGLDPIEIITTESPEKERNAEPRTQLMPKPIQGHIGLTQLSKLDSYNQKRIENGNRLIKELQNVKNINIPADANEGENIYMSFALQVDNPKDFRKKLLQSGIDTHPGDKTFVTHLSSEDNSIECANAVRAINSMVHLPVYPQMSEADIIHVAEAVKEAAEIKL